MVFGFVPIIVIGLVFGLYLSASVNTSTSVMNYSSYNPSNQTSNSAMALELSLSINSIYYTPGQEISLNISEFNTLPETNNLSSAYNWSIPGLSLGPCGSSLPIGMEVFRGYFASNNISQASTDSLQIYEPGLYACPLVEVAHSFSFAPESDNVSIIYECSPSCYTPTVPDTGSLDFKGSWAYNNKTGAEGFSTLSQGIYTAVGGDEWGDLVMLHFVVESPALYNQYVVRIGSANFSSLWRYVGNVTLSGSESACEILRLPCSTNPQNQAEELLNSDGRVAYVETIDVCGPTGCTNWTVVLISNSLYCVSPESSIASQRSCPNLIN